MSLLPTTQLETTEAGTTDVQAIINDNWAGLEEIFAPGTSSGSPVYNVPIRAIIRGAVPSARSRLEWLPGSPSKAVFRPVHATITYGGTITFDLDAALCQSVTLTGDLIIQTTTLAAGQEITLYLEASGGTRNLTWPASWRWLGTMPATVASGKILAVNIRSRGTTAAAVVASFQVEP